MTAAPTTSRTGSMEDWYMVESHEADPLFDLLAQRSIVDVDDAREEYHLVDVQRPSFAQVAALKSAQSSVNPSPIASPILRASKLGKAKTPKSQLAAHGNKYGNDYALKKSGKKFVAVKM